MTSARTPHAGRTLRKRPQLDARLEVRVTKEQKRLIQRAADTQGRSLSDFVSGTVQEAATAALREHDVIRLTAEESVAFVQAVLNPPPPNENLRAAAKDYKEFMGL